jgi:hypothetical protein
MDHRVEKVIPFGMIPGVGGEKTIVIIIVVIMVANSG